MTVLIQMSWVNNSHDADAIEIHRKVDGEEPSIIATLQQYVETYEYVEDHPTISEVHYAIVPVMYVRGINGEKNTVRSEIAFNRPVDATPTNFILRASIDESNPSVTINALGGDGDVTVKWGDGESESIFESPTTHEYAEHGTYDIIVTLSDLYVRHVTITGAVVEIVKFDPKDLESVIFWTEDQGGCPNLTAVPEKMVMPVTCTNMFRGATSLNDPNLSTADVSITRYFNGMFQGCVNLNVDLSDWMVSNVTGDISDFATDTVMTDEHLPFWGD